MIKVTDVFRVLSVCLLYFQASNALSYEGSLVADIGAGAVYNDNIFLTTQTHDSVTGIIITPSISGIIKEKDWQATLNAKLVSSTYSDDSLDGNDQFFSLSGQYNLERNIFSLNVTRDYGSNLNSTSTDFGIAGRRIQTNSQSISPQYTRLITERLSLTLVYSHRDVDFEDAENTTYTPYITQTGSASLRYSLTEKDSLTISLEDVDYKSKNDLITYQLLSSKIGIDHQFSETLSSNFLVGITRLNSTNLTTQAFDFFGNIIVQTQEIDYETRGSAYNAGITKLLESGEIAGRISRNYTSNSFGGVDRSDRLSFNFLEKLTSLWRYTMSASFDDIVSKNSGSSDLSRNLFIFQAKVYYTISKNWDANASYRYVLRKYKDDTSDTSPHSNKIYLGLSYNFPSLSTF